MKALVIPAVFLLLIIPAIATASTTQTATLKIRVGEEFTYQNTRVIVWLQGAHVTLCLADSCTTATTNTNGVAKFTVTVNSTYAWSTSYGSQIATGFSTVEKANTTQTVLVLFG